LCIAYTKYRRDQHDRIWIIRKKRNNSLHWWC
jgi:hypothetical protein